MAWTAAILTTAKSDYPPIRSLLGASDTEVPDTMIEQEPYLPTAEAIVKRALPGYAAYGNDDAILLKAGVQALAAALLCQGLDHTGAEAFRVGDFEERADGMNWQAKAADLFTAARRAMAAISSRTHTRRTLVALSGPTRSGSSGPSNLDEWVEKIVPEFVIWMSGE